VECQASDLYVLVCIVSRIFICLVRSTWSHYFFRNLALSFSHAYHIYIYIYWTNRSQVESSYKDFG